MFLAAAELYRCGVRLRARVRPTVRARAHHRCLVEAADSLAIALSAARRTEIDPILVPVRAAYAHLQRAATLCPASNGRVRTRLLRRSIRWPTHESTIRSG